MRIHHSGFKCFLENPEVYRWVYKLDLVTTEPQPALDRGIMMHKTIECPDMTDDELVEWGLAQGIQLLTIKIGIAMGRQYLQKERPYHIVARELEYCFPIPGCEHEIVGRLDAIAEYPNKRLTVIEYKGAHKYKKRNNQIKYWQDEEEEQAATVILGARSLGYQVECCEVQYILEGNPPEVWPLIDAYRSNYQLDMAMLAFAHVADQIENCMRLYGPEQPWLHTRHFNYGCKTGSCPYRDICGQALKDVDPEILATKFKKREEHLAIMGEI